MSLFLFLLKTPRGDGWQDKLEHREHYSEWGSEYQGNKQELCVAKTKQWEKKELERTPRHKLNLPNTKRFPLLPIVGCYNIFKSSFQESWTQSSN